MVGNPNNELAAVSKLSVVLISRQQRKQQKTTNRHYVYTETDAVGRRFLTIVHKNL